MKIQYSIMVVIVLSALISNIVLFNKMIYNDKEIILGEMKIKNYVIS